MPTGMDNIKIAGIFGEIADLLEVKGDNPFRIRSYRNAALTIENLPVDIKTMYRQDENSLEDLPRIGKALHEKIVEIIETGDCRFHQELLSELPSSLLEMLKIYGLGPKKAHLIFNKLNITDIEGLEFAAQNGLLKSLPGMGEKTEKKILKSIKEFKQRAGRFNLSTALNHASALIDYLRDVKGVHDVEIAGSLRRKRETIGDIDILVTCDDPAPVMDGFTQYKEVKEVLLRGNTKSSILLKCGINTDLRVLKKESFGAALHYFTGSQAHNIAIRHRAKKMGLKVNEYGVFREETETKVAGAAEDEVFDALNLKFIPPELRENQGEIEAAERDNLPELIDLRDICGDLHIHTRESDGAETIDEMVLAAMGRGYEYIAITEHSKAVAVARGLDEGRLLKHIDRIDEANKRFNKKGLHILKGIEVDILSSGELDLGESALKRLDLVVGSVHFGFNMEKDEMTARVIKAFKTGLVDVFAHPTGRLLGKREPYSIDMEAVMEAALRYKVILELNSYPARLDLNDINCKMAKQMGVMVAISTDSHNRMHLDNMKYGVYTARRGWLEKNDVLNTRSYCDLMEILKKRKIADQ